MPSGGEIHSPLLMTPPPSALMPELCDTPVDDVFLVQVFVHSLNPCISSSLWHCCPLLQWHPRRRPPSSGSRCKSSRLSRRSSLKLRIACSRPCWSARWSLAQQLLVRFLFPRPMYKSHGRSSSSSSMLGPRVGVDVWGPVMWHSGCEVGIGIGNSTLSSS